MDEEHLYSVLLEELRKTECEGIVGFIIKHNMVWTISENKDSVYLCQGKPPGNGIYGAIVLNRHSLQRNSEITPEAYVLEKLRNEGGKTGYSKLTEELKNTYTHVSSKTLNRQVSELEMKDFIDYKLNSFIKLKPAGQFFAELQKIFFNYLLDNGIDSHGLYAGKPSEPEEPSGDKHVLEALAV